MKRVIKIIVVVFISMLFINKVDASQSKMYKELWNSDVYKGIDEIVYNDKYTKLHQFLDNYLLEFRYYKDDNYYVMVLFDQDGNVINYEYKVTSDNENSNKLYYYKDRIYLIDDSVIYIYDDELNKISSESEYGGDELDNPITQVTFHDNSMYVFYRENGGKPVNNYFYVYEYDLDGKYQEIYKYEYESNNYLSLKEEQISNEVFNKQLYFYDKDTRKSISFNYENKVFEEVDYEVISEDYSLLNVFCEGNYLCDYGRVGDYYYVDNHGWNDDTNYIYGNVSIRDNDLNELFSFKNYATYKDKLMVSNDNYFIYTEALENNDAASIIYSSTLNKVENMDIENALIAKIYNNDLYVVSLKTRNINVAKYDLAFDVVINDSANGSVSVDNLLKMAGEEVMISTSSMEGYVLDTLVIVDQDGEEIKVTNNKFIMPESDVYIKATFIEGEENPETSDFIIRLLFILIICTCVFGFVRKNKWKYE